MRAAVPVGHPRGRLNTNARLMTTAKTRTHYPVTIYGLTLVCALGLASVALGIADGWVLIATGVTALSVPLVRLAASRRPGYGVLSCWRHIASRMRWCCARARSCIAVPRARVR